jgi:hypothetical protein
MTLLNEFLCEPRNDSFRSAVELRRNGLRQWRDLSNAHEFVLGVARAFPHLRAGLWGAVSRPRAGSVQCRRQTGADRCENTFPCAINDFIDGGTPARAYDVVLDAASPQGAKAGMTISTTNKQPRHVKGAVDYLPRRVSFRPPTAF